MSSRVVVGQGVAPVSGVRMESPQRYTAPDSFSVGEKTTTTWSTLFLYGFVVLLLVMMAVMLATTPVPEWMDGSGDEGPTIGGPSTHRQEKRMPWTFDNGEGPSPEGEEPVGEEPKDPALEAGKFKGYGSKLVPGSKEEPGTYGIHRTGREFQTGQLSQQRGRQRQQATISDALKNPLTSSQLRAITNARHKSKTFYNVGDKSVPV